MRVYRIQGEHWQHGFKALGWVRTEGQAKSAVKAIKDKNFADVDEWEEVEYKADDIPTDKEGLVKWLNTWSVLHGFVDLIGNIMGIEYDIDEMKSKFMDTDFEEEEGFEDE